MRAIQRTQFCAKRAKNDLKPMDFLKRDFYFETEGAFIYEIKPPLSIGHSHNITKHLHDDLFSKKDVVIKKNVNLQLQVKKFIVHSLSAPCKWES